MDVFAEDGVTVTRRFPHGSRAFVALLLFCALFFLSACDFTQQAGKGAKAPKDAKTTGGADSTRTARDENTAAYEKTTTKAAEPAVDTAFVHRASEKNSRGDYTYLSDPGLDGDPNAVVIAAPMPDLGSTGDGDYDHNIGVWYEPEAQKWAIFNQDLAAVPGGSTF